MLTLHINGVDDPAEVLEALSLVDGIEVDVVEPPAPKAEWSKLPQPGSQRQAVLLFFAQAGRATREQAKQASGIQSEGTTRIHELIQGGFLSETGDYETTAYGKPAAVLTTTDKARVLLNLAPVAWFPNGVRVGIPKPEAVNV